MDALSKRFDVFDERQERYHTKLNESLGNIDVTLVKIQADLEYHIARTDLLDNRMTRVEDDCNKCPAKKSSVAYKQVFLFLRDVSVVGSLIIIALKLMGLIDLGF